MGTRHRLLLKSRKFFEDFGLGMPDASLTRFLPRKRILGNTLRPITVSRLGMVDRLATNPESASLSGSPARDENERIKQGH